MNRKYAFRITVEGSGSFPIDMLRYGRCMPHSEADSHLIGRHIDSRVIQLLHYSAKKAGNDPFTRQRFASFGWKVTACQAITYDGLLVEETAARAIAVAIDKRLIRKVLKHRLEAKKKPSYAYDLACRALVESVLKFTSASMSTP